MSTLPKGEAMTYEECLENLKYTKDFDLYLDMLNELKSRYLIVLSVKETIGYNISGSSIEKIKRLGFSVDMMYPRRMYVGALDRGKVICSSTAPKEGAAVRFEKTVAGVQLSVTSDENAAEITINGIDCSLSDRGLNFAVYDMEKGSVVDVSCYDSFAEKPAFYHRNPYFSRQYLDTHIYMPERHRESVTLPMRRSYLSNRRLKVREVKRGIFLPIKYLGSGVCGGVCDESFNFVAGHQLYRPGISRDDNRHISGSYEVPEEEIEYIDETVLYGGTLLEHPGHLIVECFGDRMWWAAQNADSNIKIAVEIIWGNTIFSSEYNSFVMEFLDAFGISSDRLIVIEKPTRFKSIIVPDQSSVPLNWAYPYEFTSEYIKPFQHITKQLTEGQYKKIYLTKRITQHKNIVGEEYFIDFFEKKGFKIINPEDYTIKEKAELMYGADEVVTVDGTNAHFTVFCKPSVKLTILARRPDFWSTAQQLVNEAVGIKDFFLVNTSVSFLDSFSDEPFSHFVHGMAFLHITKEFRDYVKYVYNEELDITPEESIKSCLYDYLSAFTDYYSVPIQFDVIKNIKMIDILRGVSEVVFGKELDTSHLDPYTADEKRIKKLMQRHKEENESNLGKIKQLSDKAKEYIEENALLKRAASQLEAENQRLRKENSELSSYVAEINSLLDSLEAEGEQTSE